MSRVQVSLAGLLRYCHEQDRCLSSVEKIPDPSLLEAGGLLRCCQEQDRSSSSDESLGDPSLMEAGLLMSPTNSDEASPTQARAGAMTIRKSHADQAWGFLTEWLSGDENLLIVGLIAGSAQDDYNKAAAPGAYIFREYDVVTKINGITKSIDMLMELSEAKDTLSMEVSRPSFFTQVVKKNGRPLGMKLKHTQAGTAIRVRAIAEDGLTKIAGYNIKVGDLILSVNGKSGKAIKLMMEIKSASVLELGIARIES